MAKKGIGRRRTYSGEAPINPMPINIKEEVINEDPEIVLSNKGGPKLIHKGFMYTLHKRQPKSVRWRCVLRTYHCRGSLITNLECKTPFVRMCHSHPPDYAAAEVARQRYKAFGEPVSQFFNPDGTLMNIPSSTKTCTTLQLFQPNTEVSVEVMSELGKRDPEHSHSAKALRLATQNLVRQMRNIAPAPPTSQQNAQRQQQQQQHPPPPPLQPQPQPHQSHPQQQQQQPQQPPQPHHRPTKTLVLKTIPLKMKPIAPTTIKMPMRQNVQNIQQGLPQAILPQQPTEVCLRWNSYHSNMQLSFPSLLDTEQFVDVTLACEGRSLKCHKMILSSCSDYLAQLLRENPCQHPIILMKDLKFWEVEALVKFMYRGEVNVTHDKLPQLLNAAEALQIKGLAGPSNSQNPKPPLLIPQTKHTVPHQVINRIPNETKDKPSTSSNSSITAPNLISPKRGQKRRSALSEVPEARPFTKIRLQRPVMPQIQRQRSSSPTVKLEPLDIPLSPGQDMYHDDNRRDDSCSEPPNLESLIALHEEDDPGGDDIELADASSDLGNDDSTNNFAEFVPTDFLEQEQDIADDPEDQTNCSSMQFTDDDSKHNNEDEEEEEEDDDDEEEDDDEERSDEESRPDRTKKDKT